MDLGPWLVANDITVVSTVPTLVALWPPGALDDVRLLILGVRPAPRRSGHAWPPRSGRWNTYGPTEATVVACGARSRGTAGATGCPSTAGTSPSSTRRATVWPRASRVS